MLVFNCCFYCVEGYVDDNYVGQYFPVELLVGIEWSLIRMWTSILQLSVVFSLKTNLNRFLYFVFTHFRTCIEQVLPHCNVILYTQIL